MLEIIAALCLALPYYSNPYMPDQVYYHGERKLPPGLHPLRPRLDDTLEKRYRPNAPTNVH